MAITISEKKIEDKDQNLLDTLNMVYPVGSIYMSVNSTSPASLFGGTWERIKDRFLLASGDTYAAGSTGGEATHTLTVDEMPTHTHKIDLFSSNVGIGTTLRDSQQGKPLSAKWGENMALSSDDNIEQHIRNTGGGSPHNNMPPYLAVYMWKRVS